MLRRDIPLRLGSGIREGRMVQNHRGTAHIRPKKRRRVPFFSSAEHIDPWLYRTRTPPYQKLKG